MIINDVRVLTSSCFLRDDWRTKNPFAIIPLFFFLLLFSIFASFFFKGFAFLGGTLCGEWRLASGFHDLSFLSFQCVLAWRHCKPRYTFVYFSNCCEWLYCSEKEKALVIHKLHLPSPLCFMLKCRLCMLTFRSYLYVDDFLHQLRRRAFIKPCHSVPCNW